KGDVDAAIEQYKHALAINPKHVNTLSNLGTAYANKGEFDAAIEQYKHALAINPKHVNTLSNLGTAYADKGDADAAIEQYKHALDIEPSHVNALSSLGNAYIKKGEFDAGIVEYKNIIKMADSGSLLGIIKVCTKGIETIQAHKKVEDVINEKNKNTHFAKNIPEIIKLIDEKINTPGKKLFFRGQNDFKWELKSSHQREGDSPEKLKHRLNHFKLSSKAHLNIEPSSSDGDCYALMQHYGIKTPLLDFTEYLHTALFFAVSQFNLETTDGIPCLWVLSAPNHTQVSLSDIKDDKYKNKVLYPNLKDKRIRAQNGVFVWSEGEDNLDSNKEFEEKGFELHKIIIFDKSVVSVASVNKEIRNDLELMSTSAIKVYPDDKGLAYEVNHQTKDISMPFYDGTYKYNN
ncbi:tetratricopeptide repeat protein, partial [Vibrio cyclitrophicus]|uniref:tetratricopeptide repeat protein n=1 Tax=Vibrio cyclitrophicus TaxID=47951 RepID=UPI0035317E74